MSQKFVSLIINYHLPPFGLYNIEEFLVVGRVDDYNHSTRKSTSGIVFGCSYNIVFRLCGIVYTIVC